MYFFLLDKKNGLTAFSGLRTWPTRDYSDSRHGATSTLEVLRDPDLALNVRKLQQLLPSLVSYLISHCTANYFGYYTVAQASMPPDQEDTQSTAGELPDAPAPASKQPCHSFKYVLWASHLLRVSSNGKFV